MLESASLYKVADSLCEVADMFGVVKCCMRQKVNLSLSCSTAEYYFCTGDLSNKKYCILSFCPKNDKTSLKSLFLRNLEINCVGRTYLV